MRNIKRILFIFASMIFVVDAGAINNGIEKPLYPFYVGIMSGYGATTWQGLVPLEENAGDAMVLSTPTSVNEGGAVWGAFAGYDLMTNFGIEATYIRYPNATVKFDPLSLFTFTHNGQTQFVSHTETYSLMSKLYVFIPYTLIKAYSSVGVADVHRYDELANQWRVTPTFGVGFTYDVHPHVMVELGGNYTAGYGEAELEPSEDYIPFLYSVYLRLAYRF